MPDQPVQAAPDLVQPLGADEVRRRCPVDAFSFTTSDELPEPDRLLGQDRALSAFEVGLDIDRSGFNLFAFGPSGLGKFEVIRRALEERAKSEPTPPDWCYVHNMRAPHKPRAISLPAGRGADFRAAMDRFDAELRSAITSMIESDDFRIRREAIEEEAKQKQQNAFAEIEREAEERGVMVVRTPFGMMIAPLRNGHPIPPEEFRKLPQEEQERLRQHTEALEAKLTDLLNQIPRWNAEAHARIRKLAEDSATFAVSHLIEDLQRQFADLPAVLEYLGEVKADVVEHVDEIMASRRRGLGDGETPPDDPMQFSRYRVNLLVDNGASSGAPVVFEDYPGVLNLVGRIEHLSHLGTLVTNFMLVKAGALHRANGGYLMLDARRLLTQPFAWDELKRALQSHRIRIESLSQMLGLTSTVSLEPEAIPLKIKIVLIGEPWLYYLLGQLDPDFQELFKIPVDFGSDTDWTEESVQRFARWVASLARRERLHPLDRSGMSRLVEEAARLSEDGRKLSLHRMSLLDLMREADHWCRRAGGTVIDAGHIQRAVEARTYRSDRVRERIHEAIRRGTMRIEVTGAAVGQVNGLSVARLGGFSFGWPTRITARTRLGTGRVVDIEREVALGGPIHSKGVLILQGFLAARYATDVPLSLSASLVFEQSYSGVEGDSASSAELYALLSSLADLPLRQDLAVTGSVDQHGRVQAIGGVNEKIEGFFDVCRQMGLTGTQGVLIPRANVPHLMMRPDVVEAVREGTFKVYAVSTIDEGIALLTGVPAGEPGADGAFPPDSVNGRVDRRLRDFAHAAKAFVAAARKEDGDAHTR
ncbi:MAG: AAA family ATPase [Rhodospirillaceae bacterium]|nr:AAA family ATPase [Rhodospirillaceae bacterium]